MTQGQKTKQKNTHQLTKMLHGIIQHPRSRFWLLQFIVDAARYDKKAEKLLNPFEHKPWKSAFGEIFGSMLFVNNV